MLGGAGAYIEVIPHVGREPLVPGWRYLLCSDGLTEHVDLDALEATMAGQDEIAVNGLFERSMAAGGRDNISIILVRIEKTDSRTSGAMGDVHDSTDPTRGAGR